MNGSPGSWTWLSDSEDQTYRLGVAVGESVSGGLVIALDGTLGAGKTRLTGGIAAGLEIEEDVVSPTYTLCIPYVGRHPLLHLDAYRIGSPEEVDELGLDEQVESGAVLVVEWADRISEWLPPIDLTIAIRIEGDRTRQLAVTPSSPAGETVARSVRDRFFA